MLGERDLFPRDVVRFFCFGGVPRFFLGAGRWVPCYGGGSFFFSPRPCFPIQLSLQESGWDGEARRGRASSQEVGHARFREGSLDFPQLVQSLPLEPLLDEFPPGGMLLFRNQSSQRRFGLNPQQTADFSPCFHLPGFHFGYTF